MKKEEGWSMYIKIQELHRLGLNKSQIARQLGISRPTVYQYLNKSPDEFQEHQRKLGSRSKKPDKYYNQILSWLTEFPDLSGSQIYDWLEERYEKINFSEGTLRNYVRWLRTEHNIPKITHQRHYEAVVDPPMGKQMQVDFGEKWVHRADKTKLRLYVMCFILSHSRQKYMEWQDRPFTTDDIIRIHENAFEYYGGIPEEIVYDQDHLILISENHGDLVYTHKFATYLQRRRFQTYMCRKSDPETKGKVENVVGYVKHNFAHNRTYHNLTRWNEDSLAWLERRGNGKVHGTTKKIPAEVFGQERKYLRPILEKIKTKPTALSVTYQVRKDNTVPIKGNRYSVPLGTYQGPESYVRVRKIKDEYVIMHLEKEIELARHKIAYGKGELKKNTNHHRKRNSKIPALMAEVQASFEPEAEKAGFFLSKIRAVKPRYIRDQLLLIQAVIADQNQEVLMKALDFCLKNSLYSAVDFRDAVGHYEQTDGDSPQQELPEVVALTPEHRDKIKTKPQIRDISEYSGIFTR